ncbi:MAG TPA: glycosyltransferase family 1 protein [Ilumatobacteraceae bacterium]|jgi:glycosyltransferase involved in cell wall biosynthesis|nr:glycosyltransferase family 1 protein [Ilumatobacteraceae bacterium]
MNAVSRPRPVDVAVNLLWCVPGDVGGSEQYLVRQLLGLAERPGEFLPTLYCLPAFVDAHPDLAELYPMVSASITGDQRPRRVLAEHTWLRRRTGSAAIVHHGGGTAPVGGHRPIVLTIHDLQYLTHPEYLTPNKLRYLSWAIPRSVRAAAVVAVPTEYVRSTVVDAYGIDPERIVVVPHGVEPTIGSGTRSEFELRRDHGLGAGRVLVFPAITHPHKGHRFLLDVMARHWHDPDLRLVLLGGAGSAEDEVVAAIDRLDLGRRVVRPGRVPDADRDGLIALAEALVFPSEYEGFGAPVVEAMALGTPVICSDQPALAEVVGDAGLVLPRELDAWADALDVLAQRSTELCVAGRRRAQAFTARRSGEQLAAAYRAALAGSA